MQFTLFVCFYLLVGVGVATAEYLTESESRHAAKWLCVASAILFWPLHLPFLLKPDGKSAVSGPSTQINATISNDKMSVAIAQVELELDRALQSLDGWAGEILSDECDRLSELRAAWKGQAARIRELDELLDEPAFADAHEERDLLPDNERVRHSEQARRGNIERLSQVRRQLYDDLMGTLAWVRELVTMIHLAKYTGAPASRAEELITQIAAAVEGLSEVSDWQEEVLAVGSA